MKNLKIKPKLILGFLCIALMAAIVGLTGILGLKSTEGTYSEFSSGAIGGVSTLSDLRELFMQQRLILRTLIIEMKDADKLQANIASLRENEAELQDAMAAYEATIFDPSAEVDFFAFKDAYMNSYVIVKEQIINAVKIGDYDAAYASLDEAAKVAAPITESLKGVIAYVKLATVEQEAIAKNHVAFVDGILITVVVLALGLAILLGVYISSIISNPLGFMARAISQIGTTGDLELDSKTAQSTAQEARRKDEIGICAKACMALIEHLRNLEGTLESIALGDLAAEVKVLSQRDSIGRSVANVAESLNGMFGEIQTSTTQVVIGSRQISDGSQALAQGTTEQAAAAEQLLASISEITQNTSNNAKMAAQTALLAESMKQKAVYSSRQMDQMMIASKEIGEASQSISKVIKVIDDIAFQTNILALNAAVEAARAGQHGKGFAVVAEEVRNLAAKSAEAAKDTGELIENSIVKSGLGVRIAGDTAASLAEIVADINESGKLIGDIAASSENQSLAITRINKGINQVAHVIQQNSATAQESAAASEEMSEQASALETLVARFKLKDDGASHVIR